MGEAAPPSYLLLAALGPTSFMVGEQGDAKRRRNKVTIGPQRCSCRATTTVPCPHVVFVMTRVLRVPPESPLVTQARLSEREIDWVLACRERAAAARAEEEALAARRAIAQRNRALLGAVPVATPPLAPTSPCGTVRRTLTPGDECAVCLDPIHLPPDGSDAEGGPAAARRCHRPLTWCRAECGKNFHFDCLSRAVQYNPVCPLCRAPWGAVVADAAPEVGGPTGPTGAGGGAVAVGRPASKRRGGRSRWALRPRGHAVVCTGCERAVGIGNRYRCVVCANPPVDLCGGCMRRRRREGRRGDAVLCSGGERHHFVLKASPTAMWLPSEAETAAAALRRRAAAMDQMQRREITAADYDALRALDGNGATPLAEFLAQSLSARAHSNSAALRGVTCAVCALGPMGGGGGARLTELPCGHALHVACALDAFAAGAASGAALQRAITCPHAGCGRAIFPGLERRARRARADGAAAASERGATGGAVEGDGVALAIGGRSSARPLASEVGRRVFLLFTVTFHARLAHNLTRSP